MQRSRDGPRLCCKGVTEEEIMKNSEEHAMKDHGYKPEDIKTES